MLLESHACINRGKLSVYDGIQQGDRINGVKEFLHVKHKVSDSAAIAMVDFRNDSSVGSCNER